MRPSYRALSALGVALTLTLTTLVVAQGAKEKADRAAGFELKTIGGKTISLDDIRKDPNRKGATRVVLLDFWATWCPPCRAEIPHLQKLHEKYGKKGLAVVGIALDSSLKDVKSFGKEQKLTYTLLMDEKGTVGKDYRVRYFPTTYIIDKKGNVHSIHEGYTRGMEKTLEDEIVRLLK